MFYFVAIISLLGYGVQLALLAHISRKVDALDMSFYRNFSFLVTLSPLLLLASPQEILAVFKFWPQLIIMGFAAVIALWGTFASFRYLPVGVSSALKKAFNTLFVIVASLLVWGEILTLAEWLLISVIILAIVFLGFQKNHMEHLDARVMKGFALIFVSAIPSGLTVYMAGDLARRVNPFVAGYFWEASIAIAAATTIIIRYLITKKSFKWLGFKKAGKIALAAWPTLLGTGGYTLAVTLGPIGLAASIIMASVVVSTLMAHFLHDEKLNVKQWLGIIVVVLALVALKLFS